MKEKFLTKNNDYSLNRILLLTKIAAGKQYKSILNIIFTFLFPIIWTIASYYIWGQGKDQNGNYTFSFLLPSLTLLPAISLGLMAVPFTFGFDRLNNRNKIYASLNIKPFEYFIANFMITFVNFFLVTNLMLILGDFAFLNGSLKWDQYLLILINNSFLLFVTFTISIVLTLQAKTDKSLYIIILMYFYIVLFLSGVTIPAISYNPEAFTGGLNWFKWVQYLTPLGSGAIININIALPQFWNWNTDFLAILSPILQLSIALVILKFQFNWTK